MCSAAREDVPRLVVVVGVSGFRSGNWIIQRGRGTSGDDEGGVIGRRLEQPSTQSGTSRKRTGAQLIPWGLTVRLTSRYTTGQTLDDCTAYQMVSSGMARYRAKNPA